MKRSTLIPFIALVWIALVPFAHAGNDRGGGGVGVECATTATEPASLHLLELVEWRANGEPTFPPSATTVAQKVDAAFAHIEPFDAERSRRYRAVAATFFNQVEWVQDLPSTEDFGYVKLPDHCHIVQLAEQHGDPARPEPTIQIVKPRWDRLDDNDRAGLVLHEVVYQELRQIGLRNSIQLRAYISWLVVNAGKSVTQDQYDEQAMQAGLASDSHCAPTWTSSLVRYPLCAYSDYHVEFGSFLENKCRGQVSLIPFLEYGYLPDFDAVSNVGTQLHIRTGSPGTAVLVLDAVSGQSVSAVNVQIDVGTCPEPVF